MQQILLKGREHPITPQIPIVLLHRSSTLPFHFDATQPTFVITPRYIPNPTDLVSPSDSQDLSRTHEIPIPTEQHYQSTDGPPTSHLPNPPHDQNPHLDEETPPVDQTKEALPQSGTESTEHLPSTDIPQQTRLPDPYISSTDEYSDSESSGSEIEEPLDWDDMDPAQRHTWLRDHPIPKLIPSKLLITETKNLTKLQLKKLRQAKKPRLFDSTSFDVKEREPSPTPKYKALPEQHTPSPHPSPQDFPHKRDIDDEIQIDQPTSKQPRHLSPFDSTSSNLEPQQPQSPPSNDEDSDPLPILTNDGKRQQQQQDDTRDNKKQKHQENAILLTITETPLPQLITSSDPIPTPTDPLLETLAIPTPPQIVPQPHTTESTTNETTIDYPDQEQTTTRTHGFKHHSLPTIEPPFESP